MTLPAIRHVRSIVMTSGLVIVGAACGEVAGTGVVSQPPLSDASVIPANEAGPDAAIPDASPVDAGRDASPDVVDAAPDVVDAAPDVVDAGSPNEISSACILGQLGCVLRKSGVLKCWGYGARGTLGLGDTMSRGGNPGDMGNALPAVDLGTGRHAVMLGHSGGGTSMCAILDDASLKCWGFNLYGQLGLGDAANRGDDPGEMGDALPVVNLGTGRHAKKVIISTQHACAILDDDTLKCWGRNNSGQLGLGDTANRGDDAGEMGDALPVVNLGTGRHAVDIALGNESTCALLDDKTVKCFGNAYYGQIGSGSNVNLGGAPNQMGDALLPVKLGTGRTVIGITSGYAHACAILDGGEVKCWGNNDQGHLGVGDVTLRGTSPSHMGDALPSVSLGTGRTAVALGAGGGSTCALLDNGTVKCWGYNNGGFLGQGDTLSRGDAPGELGDALPPIDFGTGRKVIAMYIGWDHNCVALDNMALKCWGPNNYGGLGLEDFSNRGDAPNEMGNALPAVDF